ncbi:MAG TPA: hypothetical protein VFX02_09160 [Gammaproteobacteria bacterium]|nr:hypothetical protein [Gammaproteobacteria bacterium]
MIETREELLAKRSELWERLEAIRRDYASGLDRNMDEQSLQLENEEVLAALSREAVAELQEIEQKLRRLETASH